MLKKKNTLVRSYKHGVYVGDNVLLQGKFALLQAGPTEGTFLAQFDEIYLDEAYQWGEYLTTDFLLDKD